MATLHLLNLQSSSSSSFHHARFYASPYPCRFMSKRLYLQNPPDKIKVHSLILQHDSNTATEEMLTTADEKESVAKLLTIAEAVADRANMHAIIGAQRNNWNHLLTNSINSLNLAGSLMAGVASVTGSEGSASLRLASMLLFGAVTGMMLVVNKIQPSQLAEEQRKATWMWRQLERSIRDALSMRAPTEADVADAMDKVLALEEAYPLSLLPGMLDKFPKKVEASCWWPTKLEHRREEEAHQASTNNGIGRRNGWSKELEEELRGLLKVLKAKDEEQYVRLGEVALRVNKALAATGPIFAGLASIGSGLMGCSAALGAVPAVLAVAGGSMAAVVNTLEHAGQVGMVFELFRNNAGFYRWLQEEIEFNLEEGDVEKRENGEIFKLKLALQLGRSLSEFKEFVQYSYSSSSIKDEDIEGFAGKLF